MVVLGVLTAGQSTTLKSVCLSLARDFIKAVGLGTSEPFGLRRVRPAKRVLIFN